MNHRIRSPKTQSPAARRREVIVPVWWLAVDRFGERQAEVSKTSLPPSRHTTIPRRPGR